MTPANARNYSLKLKNCEDSSWNLVVRPPSAAGREKWTTRMNGARSASPLCVANWTRLMERTAFNRAE